MTDFLAQWDFYYKMPSNFHFVTAHKSALTPTPTLTAHSLLSVVLVLKKTYHPQSLRCLVFSANFSFDADCLLSCAYQSSSGYVYAIENSPVPSVCSCALLQTKTYKCIRRCAACTVFELHC